MWKSKLSDWKSIPVDRYKIFFELAEKRLKDILDESEKITSRSYSLIALIIPVLSLSIAELLKNYQAPNILTIIATIGIVLSSWTLYSLIQIINVRDIWYFGTEPLDILIDDFNSSESLSQEELTKALYLSEIEQTQHKISSNKKVNNTRISKFKTCLNLSLLSLIFIVVILFANYVF